VKSNCSHLQCFNPEPELGIILNRTWKVTATRHKEATSRGVK
jgi:hypothetical protein